MPRRHTRLGAGLAAQPVAATLALTAALAAIPWTLTHAATPRVHAIVGARIVTEPGRVIDSGTIVMRDGVIAAVGARVTIPADARIWRGDSLTVYAGLIDPFVVPQEKKPSRGASDAGGTGFVFPRPQVSRIEGTKHDLSSINPERRVVDHLPLIDGQIAKLREAGFTVAQVVPKQGIVRGQSAVVSLGTGKPRQDLLRADAAQVVALETARGTYPGSLQGAIAVIRQTFMDANWYRDVHTRYTRAPTGKERPETNRAWEALGPVAAGEQPALFVASDMLEVIRAAAIADEAGIKAHVMGAGDSYKRAKQIAAAGLPLYVPVDFPEAPDVADDAKALEVTTETLRHWDRAAENPAALHKAGITFALTANGLKEVKDFREAVGKAVNDGLNKVAALAAITTVPAELLGLSDKLGTIERGKVANLTVTRGDLFSGGVHEVWVDGNRYEIGGKSEGMKGNWTVGWGQVTMGLDVEVGADTTVKLSMGGDTLTAHAVRYQDDRVRFTVTMDDGKDQTFDLSAYRDRALGAAGGMDIVAVRKPGKDKGDKGKGEKKPDGEKGHGMKPGGMKSDAEAPIETPVVMGNTEAWRFSQPQQPSLVLVKNATIWTAGDDGTLEGADMLVRNGKISAIGKGLEAPNSAVVIEGTGKHVWPGIIDAHSHATVVGGVNECTNSITAEVRIEDVVNSESPNIYRHLAGGTTIAHLLHGSCNPIGGQCAVIKTRWGAGPDELVFKHAAPTIKFALGENPKRSNRTRPAPVPRYPQSRGGVEQTIRESFLGARDYGRALEEFRTGNRALPPRRDLQKDAVLEILQGKRMIHAHSYRQDEILMLMRLAEEFGVTVQCFTHVLEGYKVADEMATHGATGSSFSDWWGYKFEVIDAIPFNGYLMWDRGVTVSFNSDNSQLGRTLNLEAAKAVKYGGVPPEEAIKFVTLNPAIQLKVDDRVGSLEAGKDADFSVWNGSPLSPYSRCEQTWIEGRKYFDRVEDMAGRAALDAERAALIAKARKNKKGGSGGPMRAQRFGYLEETDLSGNDCGGVEAPFISEAERRALRGEVER